MILLNPYHSGWFSARLLADSSWIRWKAGDVGDVADHVLLAKIPLFPKADRIDRSTLLPVRVALNPPAGRGITKALIRFGYAENSPSDSYFCTSRQEACVAVYSSIAEGNPFRFESEERYQGVPCANGCTIAIPVVPQRVKYYKAVFLDDVGTPVASGPHGLAIEPKTAALNAFGSGRLVCQHEIVIGEPP